MDKKLNILLDMDGVLSDFLEGAISLFNKKLKKSFTVTDYAKNFGQWGIQDFYGITQKEFLDTIVHEDDFWFKLYPFPWAGKLYEYLCDIGNVTIITQPMDDPTCANQKMAWLKYYLGISSKDVMIGGKKYLMSGNGILIDDWDKNVNEFNNSGGKSILVSSNWNTVNLNYKLVLDQINRGLNLYNYEN